MRDPRGAIGHEGRGRRARQARRHLPQLGLHPDQGVAALVGDLPPDAQAGRVRLLRGQPQIRHRQDRRALAQGLAAALQRRRLPDEEAQDHRDRRRGEVSRRQQGRGRRQGIHRQEHRARDRRAGTHDAGPRARREADLDLSRSDGAASFSEVAARRRLRRHRHRVRELLPHARRRGDGGRDPRPRAAGGGRGDFHLRREGVRETGHEDQDRDQRREARRRAPTTSPRRSRPKTARPRR